MRSKGCRNNRSKCMQRSYPYRIPPCIIVVVGKPTIILQPSFFYFYSPLKAFRNHRSNLWYSKYNKYPPAKLVVFHKPCLNTHECFSSRILFYLLPLKGSLYSLKLIWSVIISSRSWNISMETDISGVGDFMLIL